jgi:hypothetical protein
MTVNRVPAEPRSRRALGVALVLLFVGVVVPIGFLASLAVGVDTVLDRLGVHPGLAEPTGAAPAIPAVVTEPDQRLPLVGEGRPLGSPAALVYRRSGGRYGFLREHADTVVVPADGRGPAILADGLMNAMALSPDGRLLAGVDHEEGLYLLDLVTGERRRRDVPLLPRGDDVRLAWSPDGARLGFYPVVPAHLPDRTKPGIGILDLRTLTARTVPAPERTEGLRAWTAPDRLDVVTMAREGRVPVTVDVTTGTASAQGPVEPVRRDPLHPWFAGVSPRGEALVWVDDPPDAPPGEQRRKLLAYPPGQRLSGTPREVLRSEGSVFSYFDPTVATGLTTP